MLSFISYFGLAVGEPCSFPKGVSSFLGFPHWYQYLPGTGVSTNPTVKGAQVVCNPTLNDLSQIWLIAAAVIEILVRLAAFAAIAFVIYGGISYMLSQGEPDKTAKARHTIINALAGLVLAVMSAAIVAFLAGSVK